MNHKHFLFGRPIVAFFKIIKRTATSVNVIRVNKKVCTFPEGFLLAVFTQWLQIFGGDTKVVVRAHLVLLEWIQTGFPCRFSSLPPPHIPGNIKYIFSSWWVYFSIWKNTFVVYHFGQIYFAILFSWPAKSSLIVQCMTYREEPFSRPWVKVNSE